MKRTLRRWTAFAVGGALCAASGGVARAADDIDKLGGQVFELDGRIRRLDASLQGPKGLDPQVADRRLIEAQVLYEMKNYEAASIILLDVVEKYQGSPAYPEALYFLADSLFLKRDFFSSRRYFEKIVETGSKNPRYQDALQRLVELSLYTGDYAPVDDYLSKLSQLPPGEQRPSVPYVKGKYYYFRQKYDDAYKAFSEIKVGHVYWFHSRYFVGAALVSQGKLVEAIDTFEEILRTEVKTDSQKRIAELSHLALGRVYYDRGQFTNAFNEYSKISEKSDLFPDALYEQAWVSIKSKEYKKAFRALDLFLTARPEDPLAPEVKLLIGNLHLRQNEFAEATDSFVKTRDEFEPIKKQMEQSIKGDTTAYFKDVIAKNLGNFDATTYLPPIAVKWAKADPEVERVINLTTDVGDLKKSLDEADEIVKRLDRALASAQRINIFPELADKRANVVEISNQLNDVETKLVAAERELESDVISADERRQADELRGRRQSLERQLQSLPTDMQSLADRQKRVRSQFNEIDKRATEVNVALQNYRALRVAIETYYHSLVREGRVKLTAAQREQNEKDLAVYRADEKALSDQYDSLRQEITDTTNGVGVDDQDVQAETVIQQQLKDVITRELELSSSIRGRLSGSTRVKADQIASIEDRARTADRALDAFNKRIDDAVEVRLQDVKTVLAEEKITVARYRQVLNGYEGDTVDVGSGVTAESFRNVSDRFYNIVVRADVGIIDVSWALKKTKTDEGDRLVREEKRELKLLDDEFKQVLKE